MFRSPESAWPARPVRPKPASGTSTTRGSSRSRPPRRPGSRWRSRSRTKPGSGRRRPDRSRRQSWRQSYARSRIPKVDLMATTDQLLNTLFDGRYRIVRKLGSGGMANVYLAEDQELGRRVAIKILNDRHAGDEQFVERFRREAKNAAGLSHPNIVSVFDRGEAEGTYYIAMEHLKGRNLKELLGARGPAPVHISVDIARQVLAALAHAHENGIVHRDIKPHNVMIDDNRRVKVTDFGIARAGASQMTEAGS